MDSGLAGKSPRPGMTDASGRAGALGRSRPERQACCAHYDRCYRFAPASRRGMPGTRGGPTEQDMSEVRRPSRMDARARPAPRLIYVVTEDWYFLLRRFPMARAVRPGRIHQFVYRARDGQRGAYGQRQPELHPDCESARGRNPHAGVVYCGPFHRANQRRRGRWDWRSGSSCYYQRQDPPR